MIRGTTALVITTTAVLMISLLQYRSRAMIPATKALRVPETKAVAFIFGQMIARISGMRTAPRIADVTNSRVTKLTPPRRMAIEITMTKTMEARAQKKRVRSETSGK